jgi:minor extracellular serine protease Vpr
VTFDGTTVGAAAGDFKTVTADLTATLAVPPALPGDGLNGLRTACTALPSMTGQIAVVSRGTCTFLVKVRNAQAAGAKAVLVVNNAAGDPTAMGTDTSPDQPTIAAYMVAKDVGPQLIAANAKAAKISAALAYFQTANADIMAGFSSQGPTDVDFRIKPDVVAPGVNVLSSIPGTFCKPGPCFAFFQGTSMASPHLAGSAAIVRQQHPTWSAADVRSAIVNTAARRVLKDATRGALQDDVNINGAGLENLEAAVSAAVALDPVSVSFGAVPSGSGQTLKSTVTLSNLSGAAQTFKLSISGQPKADVLYSVSPTNVTIKGGESADVTVTMTSKKGAAAAGRQAYLEIAAGGGANVAHAALFTLVK